MDAIDIVIPIYQEKEHIRGIVNRLNDQMLPPDYHLNIIIVDDASQDDTASYIKQTLLSDIGAFIQLEVNSGPAIARNKGCLAGKGQYIILIDADCLPDSSNFVMEHIQTLKEHAVSCGALLSQSPENIFWSQYQNEVFERRVKEYKKNNGSLFTTSNLAFTREHFNKVEGFDSQYYFGFEDRDFLLRSQEVGASISYTAKALVVHSDQLSITAICKKMNRGGRVESNIFRKRHLEAYKQMPYYKVDAREHAYLRPMARYIAPIMMKQMSRVDSLLERQWLPYRIKKLLVKSMTAFCFMAGTCSR